MQRAELGEQLLVFCVEAHLVSRGYFCRHAEEALLVLLVVEHLVFAFELGLQLVAPVFAQTSLVEFGLRPAVESLGLVGVQSRRRLLALVCSHY